MTIHDPRFPMDRLRSIRRQLSKPLREMARHPLRTAVVLALSAVPIWLIATTTLPYALASRSPDVALWLNPNNPVALINKAKLIRDELIILAPPPEPAPLAESERPPPKAGESINVLPESAPPARQEQPPEVIAALKAEIRQLALRTIGVDPLNATAFRLLGEVATDPTETRRMMTEAVKRSRREAIAMLWLLNDTMETKDFAAAMKQADILLTTRADLWPVVMRQLGRMSESPQGRKVLAKRIVEDPPWKDWFFRQLPRNVRRANAPLELMLELKSLGSAPADDALKSYLDLLIQANLVEIAYTTFVQLRSMEELANLGLLYNGDFEREPTGLPFDWRFSSGLHATAEISPLADLGGGRVLRVDIEDSGARVKFPEVSQILMLGAGAYKFEGLLRGKITARRGLRWQFRCLYADPEVQSHPEKLAETDMLIGETSSWRSFTLYVVVPPRPECRAQQLRLYHDARSGSEQLISGSLAFDQLSLDRVDPNAIPTTDRATAGKPKSVEAAGAKRPQ